MHDRWNREYEEREKQREKAAKRETMILARREHLLSQVSQWHQASLIREFANKAKEERLTIDSEVPFDEWLRWAYEEADRLDPLTPSAKPHMPKLD